MLQTLDVLIGFTLVMLVMSMVVTMVTQFWGSWVKNLKGEVLAEGIARLLSMLDRGLAVEDARKIAVHILTNPLVGRPEQSGTHRLAAVVHREELVKLVLDFAGDGDATKVSDQLGPPGSAEEEQQLQHRLRASLARNGIANPKEVLEAIRLATLDLEKAKPELSNSMRAAAAILEHATSEFLGKLNNWFDQTMDRVSDLFTARIQVVTFVASLSVALLFQVNAFELINRLSVDDALRNKVVAIAIDRAKQGSPQTEVESTGAADATNSTAAANAADSTPYQSANLTETATDSDGTNVAENAADTAANNLTGNATVPDAAAETPGAARAKAAAGPCPGPPACGPEAAAAKAVADECTALPATGAGQAASLRAAVHRCVGELGDVGLIAFPKSWDDWAAGWGSDWTAALWQMIGILLSAALLSLGAPFWYSLLGNLVRLRSVVARKDDVEREQRQETQPLPIESAGPSAQSAPRSKRR